MNKTKVFSQKESYQEGKTFTFSKNPDSYLQSFGLIDVKKIEPSIEVILAYSTKNNILKKDMYGNLLKCYLPSPVAEKLKIAQNFIKSNNPKLSLLILDGSRPLHIQKWMWDSLLIPVSIKKNYLTPPETISLHNYGAAVDVTLIDEKGKLLDMGSPYDYFGEISKPSKELFFKEKGLLTDIHLKNRMILREAMKKAGFQMISSEWWHFNFCSRSEAAKKFKLIP